MRFTVVTIDNLPDDVLLAIFDFYVVPLQDLYFFDGLYDTIRKKWSWHSLVHVCRRWRSLVFASPRRLNLRLCCMTKTPARSTLDVWPALPLLILGDVSELLVDNVVAELEHSDRIHQISLRCHTTSQIEKLWTAMRAPFPELVTLNLSMSVGRSYYGPVLPDSILGGSAPSLRFFALDSVPFPGLPGLLLSTTHLVVLLLYDIPHSGYISPEALATSLSMLTSLETLLLEFESPLSCPDQENRRSPPPTRSVLPALTDFSFKGVNEYLEELVARIDTPQLFQSEATFFNDIDFDISELIRFASRSSTFKAPNEAYVAFGILTASVKLRRQASNVEYFEVKISCKESGWQLSSLAQISTASLPLLSTTENLYIYERVGSQLDWKNGIENIEWLELLLPFTAVKNLYLSKQFAPRIAPTLQEMAASGTTEVLSSLQNLYLEGFQSSESVQEGIKLFISARPVAISVWDRDSARE